MKRGSIHTLSLALVGFSCLVQKIKCNWKQKYVVSEIAHRNNLVLVEILNRVMSHVQEHLFDRLT